MKNFLYTLITAAAVSVTGFLCSMQLPIDKNAHCTRELETKEKLLKEIDTLHQSGDLEVDKRKGYLWLANAAVGSLYSYDLKQHVLQHIENCLGSGKIIHLAAQFNDCVLFPYLMGRVGVAINEKDRSRRSALAWAAQCNALDAMRYLRKCGARLNCEFNDNQTPLFYAAHDQAIEAVKLFKEWGVIDLKHYSEAPILHHAAEHNAIKLMGVLIEEWHVDVNSIDSMGELTMYAAAQANAVDALKLLKKHGANIFEVKIGVKPLSCVHIAFSNTADAFALLKKWGVDINEPEQGMTPLLAACSSLSQETMDMLCFLGVKVTDDLIKRLREDERSHALASLELITAIQENVTDENAFELLCKAVERGLHCSVKRILDSKRIKDVTQKIDDQGSIRPVIDQHSAKEKVAGMSKGIKVAHQKKDDKGFTIIHYAASRHSAFRGGLNLMKIFLTCPEIDPYCKTYGTKETCGTCKSITPKNKVRKVPLIAGRGCKECGALTPYDVATEEVKALYDEMRYRIKIILALKCKGPSKAQLPKELAYIIFKFSHDNTAKYCWLPTCLKEKVVVENIQDEFYDDGTDQQGSWCSIS